ncbi:MAG: DUF692 domain-containing protein, partial [Parvibaculaceae bacterium]
MPTKPHGSPLPPVAGIGLRGPHLAQILKQRPSAGWLEVHAENYMHASPATAALEQMRKSYTLSIHGVGLSLGSARGVDADHLARLKALCDRFQPAMVSEHLAWCVGDGIYLNDLLPVPYDEEALTVVCRNIERTQEALGRRILIENLSAYVGFARATMAEPEFLAEITRRTGCGLLLDINNVFVSAHNLGFDAEAYIARLPGESIAEIHLAGHAANDTPDGPVLIDNHGSAVAPAVWSLYRAAIERFGARPTLIEWDSDIPPLETLLGEAMWADLLSASVTQTSPSVLPFLPPSRTKAA